MGAVNSGFGQVGSYVSYYYYYSYPVSYTTGVFVVSLK